VITLPLKVTPRTGSANKRKPGLRIAGTEKVSPSSPPVRSRHCSARMRAKLATASVIIEKKIARTRRLKSPIATATTRETATPAAAPTMTAPQPTQALASRMATP
jgi:hypothetical protein